MVTGLVAAILLAAAGKALWDLLQQLLFEWYGPLNPDAGVYLTIGQGIANGFHLYTDLYDQKPPLMLVLPAASLWLTGGFEMLRMLQAIVIAGFAVVPVAYAAVVLRAKSPAFRCIGLVVALLLGVAIALFTAARAGQYQTESFGAFFAMLYLVSIGTSGRLPWWRTLLAGLFLGVALGFKEPFLFSAAAGALIMRRDLRDFPRVFLLPLVITVVVGVIAMAAIGWLLPYLTIHLPEMLSHRIHVGGSPWTKPFEVLSLFASLHKNSYILKLSVLAIIAALFASPLHPFASMKRRRPAAIFGVAGFLLFELATDAFRFRQLLLGIVRPTARTFAFLDLTAIAIPVLLAAAIFFFLLWGRRALSTLSSGKRAAFLHRGTGLLLALFLLSLAIGLGGPTFSAHVAFAVPGYCALTFVFLSEMHGGTVTAAVPVIVTLLTVGTLTNPPLMDLAAGYALLPLDERRAELAHLVDATLDECSVPWYMSVGSMALPTRHTLMGPLLFNGSMLDHSGSLIVTKSMENLMQAQIILSDDVPPVNAVHQERFEYMKKQFTSLPPPCAKTLRARADRRTLGFTLYFRKNSFR